MREGLSTCKIKVFPAPEFGCFVLFQGQGPMGSDSGFRSVPTFEPFMLGNHCGFSCETAGGIRVECVQVLDDDEEPERGPGTWCVFLTRGNEVVACPWPRPFYDMDCTHALALAAEIAQAIVRPDLKSILP